MSHETCERPCPHCRARSESYRRPKLQTFPLRKIGTSSLFSVMAESAYHARNIASVKLQCDPTEIEVLLSP